MPVQYGITIHPDLNIPEFMEDANPIPSIVWATKYTKSQGLLTSEQLEYARDNFYFFETDGQNNTQTPPAASDAGRILDWIETPTPGKLYLYGSIASSGVNLAANMGAKNIILVGCDNCSLGNNHHSHLQHTRWLNSSPQQRYLEYYTALREVRTTLSKRHINLLSMNPFIGLGYVEDDFGFLCKEQGQSLFLKGEDISPSPPALWKRVARKLLNSVINAK